VTAVPLVTAPTLLSIEPVPLLKVPVNVVEPPAVIDDEPATKLLIDGAAATGAVMTWVLEKLVLSRPPVTYTTTLPTFVAGGVQLNVQDVVSEVEKAN